jgi:transcriptional regulator with XRE-family HTH domain
MPKTLGQVLKEAREKRGWSLREVERRTEIHNAHLSQIENNIITQPELAVLWELGSLYGLEFERLVGLAGYANGRETTGRERARTTAAMRAYRALSPRQQTNALGYMAKLKAENDGD